MLVEKKSLDHNAANVAVFQKEEQTSKKDKFLKKSLFQKDELVWSAMFHSAFRKFSKSFH